MLQNVRVVYVARYDFKNDDTGEVIRGCKVTYLSVDPFDEKDNKGYKTNTINLAYEKFKLFENVAFPVDCQVEFDIIDANKKPKVLDIKVL